EGRFTYQRVWSNRAAAVGGDPCVPAIAATYMNVWIAYGWYPVKPGATVSIDVTGWATADVRAWEIDAQVEQEFVSDTSDFEPQIASGVTDKSGYALIKRGGRATLQVH